MMTDPVADMLTRMRNAIQAGHDRVEFPASNWERTVLLRFLNSYNFL